MKLLPIVMGRHHHDGQPRGPRQLHFHSRRPRRRRRRRPPPLPPVTPQIQPMDESHRIQADQIDKLLAEGKVLLLDVREPKEREELGAIEDSVNIPIGQLEKRLDELPKDRLILTA